MLAVAHAPVGASYAPPTLIPFTAATRRVRVFVEAGLLAAPVHVFLYAVASAAPTTPLVTDFAGEPARPPVPVDAHELIFLGSVFLRNGPVACKGPLRQVEVGERFQYMECDSAGASETADLCLPHPFFSSSQIAAVALSRIAGSSVTISMWNV